MQVNVLIKKEIEFSGYFLKVFILEVRSILFFTEHLEILKLPN